jgi:hypothetical protein
MAKAKKAEYLIFHCSATKTGSVASFREYHVKKNKWKDIGYNAVIPNGYEKDKAKYDEKADGRLDNGRGMDISNCIEPDEIGAQTLGYNSRSLGVCLVGVDKFSMKQLKTAINLARVWVAAIPGLKLRGHYEMLDKNPGSKKTCPNIDMQAFRRAVENDRYSLEDGIKKYLSKHLKDD